MPAAVAFLERRARQRPAKQARLSGLVCFFCLLASAGRHAAAQAPPAPAPAEPTAANQNRTLPEWLSLKGTFRLRAEGRTAIGYQEDNNDGYALTRLRFEIAVKPKPWLRAVVQAQDSRSPGIATSSTALRDPFDLYQGYVDLGYADRGPARLRVGRQEMPYGAERLISRNPWRNTGRSFDAAKLSLGENDLGLDVFAASLVATDFNAFNKHRDGENFYGAYGRLNRLVGGATLEPYLLYTTLPKVLGESGVAGDADRYTAGLRLVREFPGGLRYSMELARQFGSFAGDDISAWMGYWIVDYRLAGIGWSPGLSLEYSHASGDEDPSDGTLGTFDSLFLTSHRYYGFGDLVGARNIRDLRAGLEIKPASKITFSVDYHDFWLASRNDHFYAASQQISVRVPAGGAASTRIGWEIDLTLRYQLSRRIQVGAGFGKLFPGDFLKQNTPGVAGSYPYLFWDQSF